MALVGYLYITEYAGIAAARMDSVQAPLVPPTGEQELEIHDDRSTMSAPFEGATAFVHVRATCPCWLNWSQPSPEARPGLHPLTSERDYGARAGMRVAVCGGDR